MAATLVGLYLAGLAFSLALAIALWRRDRSQLNLDLVVVWVAGAISAFMQGAFQQGPFLICLGFSSTVLTNLALARLIARLAQLTLPFRLYVGLYLAGVLSCGLIAYLSPSAPFWLMALPVGLTAPFPALHAGVKALRTAFGRLGTTAKAFLYTSLAFVGHNMDFPFLRDREDLAALGMMIALFLVWALTPTAIAAVLERTAEDRGRLIEKEAQKSRFFANISHELRTPLTLILGPIAELIASESNDSRQQTLQLVQRNGRRLLRMIDDLLDLSRMESGKLQLKLEQLDLSKVVADVCELMAPAAVAKRIRLSVPPLDTPTWIRGDAHRIEIVVGNLVNNAIKYTQVGGDVRVALRSDEENAVLVVSDNGPGIAATDHARIFERFVRLGAEQGDSTGVGIGLALSRELAEAHGGGLRLKSAPGEGAAFTLSLPRKGPRSDGHPLPATPRAALVAPSLPPAANSPAPLSVPPGSDLPIRLEGGRVPQVLIVEDEPDMRAFVAQVVRAQFECTTVENGAQAWELLQTFRPDLIVTDVMMPELTGLELCTRIKRDVSLRAIPVMLLTARSGVDAAIEGYSVGADDFLSKPFHPRELMAHVRSHLTVRQLGMQLADQARLSSSGTLAAGVAHEIRNPLNAAINALDILRDPEISVQREELLSIATECLRRIQAVTDALTQHVRPAEDLSSRPCNVRECVESTLKLLQHRTERLSIHVDLPANIEILAPARAFSQALLNLLDNGLRAANSGVWVTLTEDATMVRLAVEDDGPGIPPSVQNRIFDPFFTTRDVGEGTGLGLHLSRRLAREAGGELRHEPKVGGARFVLELPRIDHALAS